MIDKKLLNILVCPICKGKLTYRKDTEVLICKVDRLAFPIQNDIPVMLENEAKKVRDDEKII